MLELNYFETRNKCGDDLKQENDLQNRMFDYVDQIKELMSSDMWENLLLDCTKNELFIMWLLYRKQEVNMSAIAEYIHIPLNTATGIVGRMEKRGLIERNRSKEDKRVVTVRMAARGYKQMQAIMTEIMYYGQRVMNEFSSEEIDILLRMLEVLKTVLSKKEPVSQSTKKVQKITID